MTATLTMEVRTETAANPNEAPELLATREVMENYQDCGYLDHTVRAWRIARLLVDWAYVRPAQRCLENAQSMAGLVMERTCICPRTE